MTDDIKTYKFRVSSKIKIEVVPLETLTSLNRPHLITPHRTDFYHIFLFKNCSPVHTVDFTPIKIKPYSLLFIDKDRVHQFDLKLNYVGSVLIFTEDFFCINESDSAYLHRTMLFNDIVNSPVLPVSRSVHKQFEELFANIKNEMSQPENAQQHMFVKNTLHNCLLLAEREKGSHSMISPKKRVDLDYTLLFRDELDRQYLRMKNVAEYAKTLSMSEKRLGLATKMIVGKTPKEMIDERVILEAKRLLVHGNKTIKEIGFYLGFDESTNFIKYFKKHVNKTPVEFREHFLP